jgi:hypothetical protein
MEGEWRGDRKNELNDKLSLQSKKDLLSLPKS